MTWLTVDEIADQLRVSKMTIYRLIHASELNATKVGGQFRVTQDDLDTYLGEEEVMMLCKQCRTGLTLKDGVWVDLDEGRTCPETREDHEVTETRMYLAMHCGVQMTVKTEGQHNSPDPGGINTNCLFCAEPLYLASYTPVEVILHIENHYPEAGEMIRTVVETTIPAPPFPPYTYAYEYEDWEQDFVFEHTGTGQEYGESAYFVEVTSSSRPDLIPVGTQYEFGT